MAGPGDSRGNSGGGAEGFEGGFRVFLGGF